MLRSPTIERIGLSLIAVFAMLLFLRPIWDIDIFWHIATGRWIWEHGAIPYTDIFGLDPDRKWVSFQWGYQVWVYWIEHNYGFTVLRGLHALIMAAAFALLYRTYRHELRSPLVATAFLILTLLLYQDRINVRPHIFNLLGLSLLLPTLLGRWRTATARDWAGYVVLFGIWANIHGGGCLIMLVVVGALPVCTLLSPAHRSESKRALLVWVACAAPCLLNPNFIAGILSAFTQYQSTNAYIGEWHAPLAYVMVLDNPGPARILAGLLPYITLLFLGGLALGRRLSTADPVRLGLLIAFCGLSLLYVRFVHYTVPVWLILAAQNRSSLSKRIPLIGAICILLWLVWDTNIERLHGGIEPAIQVTESDLDARRFPIDEANFLDLADFQGSIFCHARFGGYLLWQLHPGIRVLVDGRNNIDRQTAEDIHFVHQNHRGQYQDFEAAQTIANIYNRYDTDALLVEPPAFTPNTYSCAQWLLVFRSPKAEIYYRNHPGNAENLRKVGMVPGQTHCP